MIGAIRFEVLAEPYFNMWIFTFKFKFVNTNRKLTNLLNGNLANASRSNQFIIILIINGYERHIFLLKSISYQKRTNYK